MQAMREAIGAGTFVRFAGDFRRGCGVGER
jgi:hypothetical protein